MAGEIRRLPGSSNPTPEEIQFKVKYLNREYPGESKWKFVKVDPNESPSDEGPMLIFERESLPMPKGKLGS